MDYLSRWEILGDLGQGGQGKVYRVLDTHKVNKQNLYPDLVHWVRKLMSIHEKEEEKSIVELFQKTVMDVMRIEDPSCHGALKVLHDPKDARDSKLAEERIKREIEGMRTITHPNLLKILDVDPDSKWFVSQFYPRGSLSKHQNKFAGDFIEALRAIRPLVEGVSELHKKWFVHRDIKPQNIFLDADDNLILGDFGLIFFTDSERARISEKFENVGSRDWMPPWAQSIRVEEVKPTFDAFSLGKVLWSMVSGSPILPLWYFEREKFNVEKIYPESPYIRLVNPLLRKCVVEDEKDCLRDAAALLAEIDETLSLISYGADLFAPQIERRCKVCGIGRYKLNIDDENPGASHRKFGIDSPYYKMKIFICDNCGNVQFFAYYNVLPPAWNKVIDLRGKR